MYTVHTLLLALDPHTPDPQIIAQAAARLRAGGLVAFPTETVYGLGANAFDAAAIERIFEVKRRPAYDPLIVHIADLAQLDTVAEDIPELARQLAAEFWPGPLTLVLQRRPQVAANISAGLGTVAVRMPGHQVPLALIAACGVPVAAPSANLFTRPSPTRAQHVLDDLAGHVDIVLDGGPTRIGLESTVLDLTRPAPTLLRPGGVPAEALQRIIPTLVTGRSESTAALTSPGLLVKHYSPSARFLLFTGRTPAADQRFMELIAALASRGYRVGLMTVDAEVPRFASLPIEIASLGPAADLNAIGQNLFAQMRHLEKKQVDLILMRAVDPHGLGLAIRDRLSRAAEQQIHDLDLADNLPALLASLRLSPPA